MHERARPGYVCFIERDDSTPTGSYSYLRQHVIVMPGRYGLDRSIAVIHLHTHGRSSSEAKLGSCPLAWQQFLKAQ
jgi:hypothetical protein